MNNTKLTGLLVAAGILSACAGSDNTAGNEQAGSFYGPDDFTSETVEIIDNYPETVFYEIFVRAFYDSSGNGTGDIQGMTEKLDYIVELGAEALWLMPVNPSPTYHGYDVTDYYDINPDYGTLDDFKVFVNEAHNRDIKVIIDFVVNHTSYEHEWFQEALKDEDSAYRDWYIWADEDTNISERGEWGQRLWHGSGDNQYMSVFWEGMPDLNMDNEDVREQIYDIGRFWLEDVGVDGFRLDAAKHIYPGEADKNHEFWAEFRSEMEAVNEDVFLVGEVWDIPQVTGPYLEEGFHSTFNFDLSEDLIQAVRQERGPRLVSSLQNILERYDQYADDYTDATFLTNHDVDRVMSQLQGNESRAKMAASLLLSLPGSPFIYYGEEIGMAGSKPDEHIREPMLWYENDEEAGQTSWIRPRHNQEDDSLSVESGKADRNSIWHHYQTWIHLRRSHPALLAGNISESHAEGEGIVSFIRKTEEQHLLIIHNLSGEDQEVSLSDEEDTYKLYYADSEDVSYDTEEALLVIPSYSSVILK